MKPGALWSELKRRDVIRSAGVYIVAGWVLIQVIDTVGDFIGLPLWLGRAVITLFVLMFPLVIYLAWAYTFTASGLHRFDASDEPRPVGPLDYVVIGVFVCLLAVGGWQVLQYQSELTKTSEVTAPGAAGEVAARTAVNPNSIAVLPFTNMSSDPEQEYFSDGITEEILNVLAKMPGLQVTSRTSSFSFKNQNMSVPQIAAALGVAYILEGSVRKSGNRARITAQLIEVDSDSHVFSDAWDRELDDVFAVQDEVSKRIGEILELKLPGSIGGAPRTVKRQALPSGVLDDYLRATQLMTKTGFTNAERAVELLRGIIAVAPELSQAYSRLAAVYLSMIQIGSLSPEEAVARALPEAETALALDPGNADTLNSLSFIHRLRGDAAKADDLLDRALALEPGNAAALQQAVGNAAYGRKFEERDELVERLLRVDPRSEITLVIAQDYFRRGGNPERARQVMEQMESLPDVELMYATLMAVNEYYEGGPDKQLEFVRRAYDVEPRFSETAGRLVQALLDAGRPAEALKWLNEAPALADDPFQRGRADMLYREYVGDKVAAFELARALLESTAPDRYASKAIALRVSLEHAIQARKGYADLIELYLATFPELAEFRVPNSGQVPPILIKYGHFMAANDLALLYQLSGREDDVAAMDEAIEEALGQWPRRSVLGSSIADVEFLARNGRYSEALSALGSAIDGGWHQLWWLHLDHSPHLDGLRELPAFLLLRDRFAAFEPG